MFQCKKKFFIFINLVIILFCVACSSKADDISNAQDRLHTVYNSSLVSIENNDYYCSVNNVIFDDDNYYAIALQHGVEDKEDSFVSVFSFTEEEDVISEHRMEEEFNIYTSTCVRDNKLYYVTWDNRFCIMDLQTDDIIFSQRFSEQLCGVSLAGDGYVLSFNGKIEKYDWDNNYSASIQNDEWSLYDYTPAYFEQNGNSYLVISMGLTCKYYSLDFDSPSSELILDTGNLGIQIKSHYKEYLFTEECEYKIDFENRSIGKLASWEDMNYQPPRYGLPIEKTYGVNDDVFVSSYSYLNGISEIIIYTYDSTTDYSDRIPLVVGGYYCSYDLPLRWAVYNFNTSQDEYRAYIDEYSDRFSWSDYEEAMAQKAALIQYFNDGNAPDIFYGNYFDYESLNTSGYIQDMRPYLDEYCLQKIDGLSPSIHSLIVNDDGSIYQLFSSYMLDGYIGSSDYLDNNREYAINDLVDIAESNGLIPFKTTTSTYLAINLFGYSLGEDTDYSISDIEAVLDMIYANSYAEDAPYTSSLLDYSGVRETLVLDYPIYSIDLLDEYERNTQTRFTYVGYPSLGEACHVVEPSGQMGLSSTTSYPEASVQLMTYLLDDDIQRLCYTSDRIPVSDEMFEEYLLYHSDHSSIPSDDHAAIRYFEAYHEVSEDAVEDFRLFCSQADTIIRYDWGLSYIIQEEVGSYYSSNKPISEIAESLRSRIDIYISENN